VRIREHKDQSVSKRGQSPLPADNARHEAKTTQGNLQQSSETSSNSTEQPR
jgi:serine/threonine-protein kinase PRP4